MKLRAAAIATVLCGTCVVAMADDVNTPDVAGSPVGLAEALSAAAQSRQSSLERAETLARETEATAARLAALRQELVIAAYAEQDAETVVVAVESRIADTRAEQAMLAPQLSTAQTRLFDGVLALHRVARDSPLARLATGEDPNDVVRAGIVVAAMAPGLHDAVSTTADRLRTLGVLERTLSDQLDDVRSARDKLAIERSRIDILHTELDQLYASNSAALVDQQARADALADEVETLAGLVAALRRASAEAPQVTIEIAAQGSAAGDTDVAAPAGIDHRQFVAPVRGEIVGLFDDSIAGAPSGGLHLTAVAGARVVSPFAGHVAYAGTFPGRDLVLIIDHGGGYHSVLTGLARIDTSVGRQLLAGEPVGTVGDPGQLEIDDQNLDGLSRGRARLYFELRRDGTPIDPMPWYSTINDGMNG